MPDAPSVPPPAADLRDHLALALVPGLGPKLTAALMLHFGTAAAARHATVNELLRIPLIGDKLAQSFAQSLRNVDVDAEERLLIAHNVRAVILGRDEYPLRLTEIADAPPLLYFRGEITPADSNSIAIVGSRACTSYGLKTAERIAASLARAGWTVISGLARGIDGAAHKGAIDAGGRTLAVLAGGLSRIYPPEHAELADAVASQGCLITETPMTVQPQPGMFPARNRIISGLCRGVVVIEANAKSGALITVDHAAEQGREVFAVPGQVDSPSSAGCLELIRKGAKLVRDADDILDDIRGIAPPDPIAKKPSARKAESSPTLFEEAKPAAPLDGVQQQIWDALTGAKHADELARTLGLPIGDLNRNLMQLELKKVIRRLPGNQYERRR